jgi:transcriptional regulator with XRE-family HTH domain/DNA-directed RNA polymerase subunit RPC12/RpoP
MDQIKIGKFIAARRRRIGMTQMQMAQRLNVTDRAVSKWETGRSLPDSSIMLALCDILNITVNDLLCGEVVTMENSNKELERKLVELIREKEESDKRLLRMEIVTGIMSVLPLIVATVVANVIPMEEWLGGLIVGICLIPLLIATPFMIRIEQTAGYYECAECSHRYVPRYGSVFLATHMGRTRYMRCPACGKKSWQKKVIGKK